MASLVSATMPYPAGLPFRATVPSHPMHSTTYSTPHCLRSRKVFPAVGTICASPTCRGNEVIISRASLDGVESERSVGRNRVRSSLVQTSASSEDEGSPSHQYWSGLLARWRRSASAGHRVDDRGLTPASHRYARVVTRWLEILASYAGRPNLTVSTSKAIGSLVVYLVAPDRWSAGKPWSTERIGMWGWRGTRKMMMYEVWRMMNTV